MLDGLEDELFIPGEVVALTGEVVVLAGVVVALVGEDGREGEAVTGRELLAAGRAELVEDIVDLDGPPP